MMMPDEKPKFFNPFVDIEKTANNLPHWQQPGATYFITFRLGDAIPAALRTQWLSDQATFLRAHPRPWGPEVEEEYHLRFSHRVDQWLDAGHGECLLRDPCLRSVVEECLIFFDQQRYDQHAWVIMPNHVHTLTTLRPGWQLEQVVSTWKSFTANRIHRELGRQGSLWQEDYFDRLIRDADHFSNVVRYIRRNPTKAKLSAGEYSSFATELANRMAP